MSPSQVRRAGFPETNGLGLSPRRWDPGMSVAPVGRQGWLASQRRSGGQVAPGSAAQSPSVRLQKAWLFLDLMWLPVTGCHGLS